MHTCKPPFLNYYRERVQLIVPSINESLTGEKENFLKSFVLKLLFFVLMTMLIKHPMYIQLIFFTLMKNINSRTCVAVVTLLQIKFLLLYLFPRKSPPLLAWKKRRKKYEALALSSINYRHQSDEA